MNIKSEVTKKKSYATQLTTYFTCPKKQMLCYVSANKSLTA